MDTLRSDKSIIDIGLSIFEYDLIVNVVVVMCVLFYVSNPCPDFFLLDGEPLSGVGAPTTYNIEIYFIEFSTGNPHPHAREHRILYHFDRMNLSAISGEFFSKIVNIRSKWYSIRHEHRMGET